MEYTHKTYGTGFALKVSPSDRSVDVMHYFFTGTLLGGRSLDGVDWEEVVGKDYDKIQESRSKALIRDMSITKP